MIIKCKLFFILLAVSALLCPPQAIGQDWSQDTYVIWAMKDAAPKQEAVVSWSDWLVFSDATFGDPGVRFIINKAAASGIRTIWWRTFGGGQALYSSKVDDVTTGNYPGQGADYSEYDSLAEAVRFSHELGLKVKAWYTPLEEAHAWEDNVRSRYVDLHKDLWDRTSSGAPAGAPSMAYAEYRKYKLDLAREVIRNYDIDGMVIDFERRGSPGRSNSWGYLPQVLKAFAKQTGRDATKISTTDHEWMAFRAKYVGMFMKEVKKAIEESGRPISFEAAFPASVPLSAHCDIAQWCSDRVLENLVILDHGKAGWGNPSEKYPSFFKTYEKYQPKNLSSIIYSLLGSRKEIMASCRDSINAGFDSLVWFETTYLYFGNKYDIPTSLAFSEKLSITSPAYDMSGGAQINVLCAGDWSLKIGSDSKVIARGKANKLSKVDLPKSSTGAELNFECILQAGVQYAGLVVEGQARGVGGNTVKIATDKNWKCSSGKTLRIGKAGIPPFMGEQK